MRSNATASSNVVAMQNHTRPRTDAANRKQPFVKLLTLDELYVYTAIHILMGYNRQPRIRDYWSNCTDSGARAVKKAMTRQRFNEISRYLHYSTQQSFHRTKSNKRKTNQNATTTTTTPLVAATDEEDDDEEEEERETAAAAAAILKARERDDGVLKVRLFSDLINKSFRRVRCPRKTLTIDESMIAFRGRSDMKVRFVVVCCGLLRHRLSFVVVFLFFFLDMSTCETDQMRV
jgi:Transposase IS4